MSTDWSSDVLDEFFDSNNTTYNQSTIKPPAHLIDRCAIVSPIQGAIRSVQAHGIARVADRVHRGGRGLVDDMDVGSRRVVEDVRVGRAAAHHDATALGGIKTCLTRTTHPPLRGDHHARLNECALPLLRLFTVCLFLSLVSCPCKYFFLFLKSICFRWLLRRGVKQPAAQKKGPDEHGGKNICS